MKYAILKSVEKSITIIFFVIILCFLSSQLAHAQNNIAKYHASSPAGGNKKLPLKQLKISNHKIKNSTGKKIVNSNLTTLSSVAFYVNDNSTTGDVYTSAIGNDANPGTSSSPFATIQHAISVASDGDIIYVDAGTYVEDITVNKQLDFRGANYQINPNSSTRNNESELQPATSGPEVTSNPYEIMFYVTKEGSGSSV